MSPELALTPQDFETRAISPLRELGAYEALWDDPAASFKVLSEKFAARPDAVPSDFVPPARALECAAFVQRRFREAEVTRFGVRVHGAGEYPEKLRDAAHPVELLYFQGWWDLASSRAVAVVGTREPTREGVKRTRQLVQALVKDDFTVVAGLAAGIDTTAHETAIAAGGRTIAVIGTPLSHTYPRENSELQRKIAREFLVISQVPVREPGFPAEPVLLSGAQHHDVSADRSNDHCGSRRDLRHADPGPRRSPSEAQAVHSR